MSKIVADSQLSSQLSAFREMVYVVDVKGRPLGTFTPIDPALLESPFSEEEVQQSLNSDERGFTTAELLASLEKARVSR